MALHRSKGGHYIQLSEPRLHRVRSCALELSTADGAHTGLYPTGRPASLSSILPSFLPSIPPSLQYKCVNCGLPDAPVDSGLIKLGGSQLLVSRIGLGTLGWGDPGSGYGTRYEEVFPSYRSLLLSRAFSQTHKHILAKERSLLLNLALIQTSSFG